jgi:leucine-rich repeat protein SHOC2
VNLRRLDFAHDKLTSLPAPRAANEIGNLVNSQILESVDNLFISVLNEIGNLVNRLYLQCNQLISIPNDIGNLASLRRLYLHDNQLNSRAARGQ